MPETWPAKDPQAVKDYTFTIPLDEGDTVAAYTFTKVSGDVVLDSESRAGAVITAWLSGGTTGETAVFKATWETTAGREDEDYVTQLIASADYVALELTDYQKPLPQHLIARYPDFAAVPTATIQYWLTDAERFVDDSWLESDYAAGLMAVAAHNMAVTGLGTEAAATADLPPGITAMKIGTLGLNFDSAVTKAKAEGTWSATRYGTEYQRLLRRNKGGPRVTATGTLPTGYPGEYISSGGE